MSTKKLTDYKLNEVDGDSQKGSAGKKYWTNGKKKNYGLGNPRVNTTNDKNKWNKKFEDTKKEIYRTQRKEEDIYKIIVKVCSEDKALIVSRDEWNTHKLVKKSDGDPITINVDKQKLNVDKQKLNVDKKKKENWEKWKDFWSNRNNPIQILLIEGIQNPTFDYHVKKDFTFNHDSMDQFDKWKNNIRMFPDREWKIYWRKIPEVDTPVVKNPTVKKKDDTTGKKPSGRKGDIKKRLLPANTSSNTSNKCSDKIAELETILKENAKKMSDAIDIKNSVFVKQFEIKSLPEFQYNIKYDNDSIKELQKIEQEKEKDEKLKQEKLKHNGVLEKVKIKDTDTNWKTDGYYYIALLTDPAVAEADLEGQKTKNSPAFKSHFYNINQQLVDIFDNCADIDTWGENKKDIYKNEKILLKHCLIRRREHKDPVFIEMTRDLTSNIKLKIGNVEYERKHIIKLFRYKGKDSPFGNGPVTSNPENCEVQTIDLTNRSRIEKESYIFKQAVREALFKKKKKEEEVNAIQMGSGDNVWYDFTWWKKRFDMWTNWNNEDLNEVRGAYLYDNYNAGWPVGKYLQPTLEEEMEFNIKNTMVFQVKNIYHDWNNPYTKINYDLIIVPTEVYRDNSLGRYSKYVKPTKTKEEDSIWRKKLNENTPDAQRKIKEEYAEYIRNERAIIYYRWREIFRRFHIKPNNEIKHELKETAKFDESNTIERYKYHKWNPNTKNLTSKVKRNTANAAFYLSGIGTLYGVGQVGKTQGKKLARELRKVTSGVSGRKKINEEDAGILLIDKVLNGQFINPMNIRKVYVFIPYDTMMKSKKTAMMKSKKTGKFVNKYWKRTETPGGVKIQEKGSENQSLWSKNAKILGNEYESKDIKNFKDKIKYDKMSVLYLKKNNSSGNTKYINMPFRKRISGKIKYSREVDDETYYIRSNGMCNGLSYPVLYLRDVSSDWFTGVQYNPLPRVEENIVPNTISASKYFKNIFNIQNDKDGNDSFIKWFFALYRYGLKQNKEICVFKKWFKTEGKKNMFITFPGKTTHQKNKKFPTGNKQLKYPIIFNGKWINGIDALKNVSLIPNPLYNHKIIIGKNNELQQSVNTNYSLNAISYGDKKGYYYTNMKKGIKYIPKETGTKMKQIKNLDVLNNGSESAPNMENDKIAIQWFMQRRLTYDKLDENMGVYGWFGFCPLELGVFCGSSSKDYKTLPRKGAKDAEGIERGNPDTQIGLLDNVKLKF